MEHKGEKMSDVSGRDKRYKAEEGGGGGERDYEMREIKMARE